MSYLQLRSRRLEKLGSPATRPNEVCKVNMRSRPDPNPISSASVSTGTVSRTRTDKLPAYPGKPNPGKVALPSLPSSGLAEMANLGMQLPNDAGFEVEVSFGDNVLEAEELNRNLRETTPSCLIMDAVDLGTPGSSTRPSSSTTINGRTRSLVHHNIPTTKDIEDFFAAAEQSQLKLFTEKYNFDPVNDCPLPGRYEWIKLA
ncbi:hypothetical protein HPP92_026870 [Vanilla planifolia]|nr:hypothetical protein HPP92_026870 [Vanilla planifolia]